jgi:hypothetical protein
MVIDNLGPRLRETLVAHLPVTDPGEACTRHARSGIRHLVQAQVGRLGQRQGVSRSCGVLATPSWASGAE